MNKNMSLTVKASLATLLALGVPVLMASENWDDNDRSGRYTMRDFGQNYLKSCEPNAIIFTNGDNDTFPLWYNQEVEKFRTDVRVCNLSYLQTDWYIDQMRRWSFQSAPLPINLPSSKYIQGVRDVSPTKMMIQEPLDLRIALEFFNNDSVLDDSDRNFMPSRNLYLTVDKDLVLKNGVVLPQKADSIVDRINITLGSSIAKNEYMVLQMLQDNDWKRPIYYATTVGSEANLGLPDYLQLEGLASRLVPIKQAGGSIDTERMFNNLMHKFKWGGIVENPNVYFDETSRRMYSTSRFMFSQLIQALIDEGKNEKALQATDYCLQVIPGTSILHNYFSLNFAKYYYQLGEKQKAETLMQEVINSSTDNLNWFFSLRNQSQMLSAQDEIAEHLFALQQAIRISQEFNPELSEQFMKDFLPYFQMYDTL